MPKALLRKAAESLLKKTFMKARSAVNARNHLKKVTKIAFFTHHKYISSRKSGCILHEMLTESSSFPTRNLQEIYVILLTVQSFSITGRHSIMWLNLVVFRVHPHSSTTPGNSVSNWLRTSHKAAARELAVK
jgi:hypothetical protein